MTSEQQQAFIAMGGTLGKRYRARDLPPGSVVRTTGATEYVVGRRGCLMRWEQPIPGSEDWTVVYAGRLAPGDWMTPRERAEVAERKEHHPMIPGNPARERAIDLMLGGALTRQPVDNAKAVLFMQLDRELVPLILERRRAWLDWITVSQRRWQRETRRPSRARHHDSIAIRERYVRCGSS